MLESQSSEFNAEKFKISIHSWKQTRLTAAMSANASYQRALRLAPWQANVYADIAITSDLVSSLNEDYGRCHNAW